MNQAVFLDRDGTINEEVGYLTDLAKLRLIPGAGAALKRLNEAGLKVIVVTNQSGVARGYFSESLVQEAHKRLEQMLRDEGARLDGIYYCPHHPASNDPTYAVECGCRKPGTVLIDRAARDLDIDVKASYVVGDKWSDIDLAQRAGAHAVLVQTGFAHDDPSNVRLQHVVAPDFTARDITEATEWIVKHAVREKPNVSAFVITKNNADTIDDCLRSLLWADEVIVVDDFSTDATPEICRQYPRVKFQQHSFEGFQQQKEYAVSLAQNDWVLKIDADERVSEKMRDYIAGLTKKDFDTYSCFEFRRCTYFWGRWIKHASLYPDYNPRLFHKNQGSWGGINPHDKFITRGRTKKLDCDILHFQNWDLITYASRTVLYSVISANEYYKRGKRAAWHHFTIRPLYTFLYRYIFRLGFLEGAGGFVISVMGAVGTFVKYMKLYELQTGKMRPDNRRDEAGKR